MNQFEKLFYAVLVTLITVLLLTYTPKSSADTQADTKDDKAPQSVTITLPNTFDGNSKAFFLELGRFLKDGDYQVATLEFYGVGGASLIGNQLINDIEDAQSHGKIINMRVVGPAYSMHAFLTCFANKVTLDDGAALMFHSVYSIKSHLFGLITTRDTGLDPASEAMQNYFLAKCELVQRLSKEDIKVIRNGGDVYISRTGNTISTSYQNYDFEVSETASQILDLIIVIGLGLIIIAVIKRI